MWGTVVQCLEHWTPGILVMITRLWVLVSTRAHCVVSLSKTLNPGEKRNGYRQVFTVEGMVKQTCFCRRNNAPPQKKNKQTNKQTNKTKLWSLAQTLRNRDDNNADSLELRFRLYIYI